MDMSSTMTHYMELLASNQPWNLLIFMAIPVIFAEFIAVTELQILFQRKLGGTIKRLNGYAGLFVGFYFVGVFVYLLFNAVIPITAAGAWRGPADVIAVGFYLLSVVPLLGMALLELKVVGRTADAQARLKLHAGSYTSVLHFDSAGAWQVQLQFNDAGVDHTGSFAITVAEPARDWRILGAFGGANALIMVTAGVLKRRSTAAKRLRTAVAANLEN